MEKLPPAVEIGVMEPPEDKNVRNNEINNSGNENLQVNAEQDMSDDCEIVEVCEINDVVMVEDSDSEVEGIDFNSLDEIVLDDIAVDRMDVNQKLDSHLDPKEINRLKLKQIFIGNLPQTIKVVYLVEFFKKYGKIIHVKFMRSLSNHKCICFLTYNTERSALKALEANGLYYNGHNFRVAPIGRKQLKKEFTISVPGLGPEISYQDLYNTFEDCGPIESLYMAKEKKRFCTHITFEFRESVTYALLLSEFKINNRQVIVNAC